MQELKELTKAEEQVMQVLWNRKKCFVKDVLKDFEEPKPAYNTVSTIIRILETKGFVAHEVFGKSHRYYPIVEKDTYRKYSINRMVQGYFSGSASNLVSFFLDEKKLNAKDLDEILKLIENKKGGQK